ncbi:peptidase G1 domain-containing protein [Phanerochaete sordida]|uniref:Peptidase G1 domain-containing protein n=1 Tax=Phanerochaete sordida TaxID=48140 RepID=A0A9P3GM81_9APHY|nr:peptidase G1 domain-containing protein [Phanerochaete sordida]
MLFSTLAIASLAASVFALPSSQEHFAAAPAAHSDGTDITTYAQYSANWAGAALRGHAGTIKEVTATIKIPTIHRPVDQPDGEYNASIWLGVDGDTCSSASARIGLDVTVNASGVIGQGWYSSNPGRRSYLTGPFNAGDSVKLRVTVNNATSGSLSMLLSDETNGKGASIGLSSSVPLCAQDALWVVEDPERNGALEPLADFTSVLFDTATVTLTTGEKIGPQGARAIEMYQGRAITYVDVQPSSVRITYL